MPRHAADGDRQPLDGGVVAVGEVRAVARQGAGGAADDLRVDRRQRDRPGAERAMRRAGLFDMDLPAVGHRRLGAAPGARRG